ncbi:PEP-CTERM sorting domain-containing protein [Duganella sp. Dugasp56]|uniref:PEP-CTERM sorting domain-containing protein n=1 Tax=Duganella sp. Dugasp56 TaxID=3243046 RepID=UPI00159EB4E9
MPNHTKAPAKPTISYKAGAAAVLAMSAASAGADVIVTHEFNNPLPYSGVQTTVGKDKYLTNSFDVDHNGTIDYTYTKADIYTGTTQPPTSALQPVDLYDTGIYASGLGVGNSVAPGSLIGPALDMLPSERLAYTHQTIVYTKVYPNGGDCKRGSCGTLAQSVNYEMHDQDLYANHRQVENSLGFAVLLPFSFLDGTQVNYGWVDATIVSFSGEYATYINAVGYDNTGAAVVAGAAASISPVPEPSSLAMLATGLAGLGAYRGAIRAARRRRARA